MAESRNVIAQEGYEGRDWTPAERLEWLNETLQVDKTGDPITGVVVDGYEEGSAVVLLREGARQIVFPGSKALLDPRSIQTIVGAVIRRALPNFTREDARKIADLVWSLSTMRNIYDSVDAAVGWGRSYVYGALQTDPIPKGRERWEVFERLRLEERTADNHHPPPPRVLPWDDGARLVIRPWFNQHVRVDLGHEALSEQRIGSLMALTGWRSLPSARSALTAHNPDRHVEAIQFRFYVVPGGWEPALEEAEGDE